MDNFGLPPSDPYAGAAPRPLVLSDIGQDTTRKRLNILQNARSGVMTTYEIDPTSKTTMYFAQHRGFQVLASNRLSDVSGNNEKAFKSLVGTPGKITELPEFPNNPANPNAYSLGDRQHSKIGSFRDSVGQPFVMIASGNMIQSDLGEKIGLRQSMVSGKGANPETHGTYNFSAISRDPSLISQVNTVLATIAKGEGPSTTKDLLVVSPADLHSAKNRILDVINNPDNHNKIFIESATLSNRDIISALIAKAERGDTVEVGLGGITNTDHNIEKSTLNKLRQFDPSKGGHILAGFAKGNRQIHNNSWAMGTLNSFGSMRYSQMAMGDNPTDVTTEVSLISDSADAANKIRDQKKLFDLKDITIRDSHFIDTVDYWADNKRTDLLIPSQMTHEMRKMYQDTGMQHSPNNGGVLTSSYVAYKMRAGYSYMQAISTSGYAILRDTQNTMFEARTWGESWNQLGSRGAISSWAINTVQSKWGWNQTAEQMDYRFNYLYKPKPVYEDTTAADFTRQMFDYVENSEMNLFGFYAGSTVYSVLQNQFMTRVGSTIESSLIGKPMRAGAWNFMVSVGEYGMQAARSMAVDVTQSVISPTMHAIDILTGTAGKSSFQWGVDVASHELYNVDETSIGEATRTIFRNGDHVIRKNVLMRATGASLFSEFFSNFHVAVGTQLKGLLKEGENPNARIFWEDLWKDTSRRGLPEGPGFAKARVSSFKVLSGIIFGAVVIDRLTAYLGEHLGGLDTFKQDRANQILKEAAREVGGITGNPMNPVQMRVTGNAGRSGNPYLDMIPEIVRLPFVAVSALVRNIVGDLLSGRMKEVLGPNVIYQGQEMQAAQKAAAQGNKRLAAAYLLMSNDGPKLFRDNTYKADMWRSWVVQIAPNPLIATFTMAASEHRGGDGRSVFSHDFEEVREFSVSIQGPVMVTIGVSTKLPFAMVRELGRGPDVSRYGYEAWTTYFTPGSGIASQLGMVALLRAGEFVWNFVKSGVAKTLTHAVAPIARGLGKYRFAGAAEGLGESFAESLGRLHTPVVELRGKPKIMLQGKMGAFTAVKKILTLPYTIPIEAARISANLVLGTMDQAKWSRWNPFGIMPGGLGKHFGIGVELNEIGSATAEIVGNRKFIDSNTRRIVRESLSRDLGINSYEDFKDKMLTGSGKTELNLFEHLKMRQLYRDMMSDWRVPNLTEMATKAIKGPMSFGRLVAKAGRAGVLLAGVSMLALSLEAHQHPVTDNYLQANWAYTMASKMSAWAASAQQLTRSELATDKASLMYRLASSINDDKVIPALRGALMLAKSLIIMADYHGNFRNLRTIGAGVIAEGILMPVAGFDTSEMKYDPYMGTWTPKNGVWTQETGVLSLAANVFKNGLSSFFQGFYHPFGQKPYLMLGPIGATMRAVDKDREEWAGWFSQMGPMMFMQSGYSEQFIFKEGWQKRRYQQWKDMRKAVWEPLGLRQLQREKAIRSGKMYHEDLMQFADSWGLKMELTRRAQMSTWAKHVDPYDYLFVPGLITEGKNTTLGNYFNARKYRDPKSPNEEALEKLVAYYGGSVVGQVVDPGKLKDSDDELQLVQALNDNQKFSDFFSRPYEETPANLEANFFGNPIVKLAVMGSAGMAGILGIGWLVGNLSGPKNWGSSYQGFISHMHRRGGASEEKLLEKLTRSNPSELSRFVEFEVPMDAHSFQKLYYLKAGQGTKSPIYVKPGQGVEIDPKNRSFKDVFWTLEELKSSGLQSYSQALNKLHHVNSSLDRMRKSNSLNWDTLSSVHHNMQQLSAQAKSLTEIRSGMQELEEVQGLIKAIETGSSRLAKLQESMTEHMLKDSSQLSRTFKLTGMPFAAQIDGEVVEAAQVLMDLGDSLKGMDKLLTKSVEGQGLIKSVGKSHTNALNRFLRKRGFSEAQLRNLETINEVSSTLETGNIDAGVHSMEANNSFIREARSQFWSSYGTRVMQELDQPELEQLLRENFESDDVGKTLKNLMGAALSRSKILNVGDADPMEAVVRSLHQHGKISDEDFNRLVNGRLEELKGYARQKALSGALKGAVLEGVEHRLGMKAKIKLPSVPSALMGGVMWALDIKMNITDPAQEEAYFAGLAHESQLNGKQQQWAAKQAWEYRWDLITGIIGNTTGSALGWVGTRALSWAAAAAARGGTAAIGWLGGPVGEAVGLFAGMLLGNVIQKSVKTAVDRTTSEQRKVTEGMGYKGSNGIIDDVGIDKKNTEIFNYFEAESRSLMAKKAMGKLQGMDKTLDWAINGDYDPTTLEVPRGGWLRQWVDKIHEHKLALESGQDPVFSSIFWQRKGGSPSLIYGGQFAHSELWIGNDYDVGQYLAAQQNTQVFEGPQEFRRNLVHSSTWGVMKPNKQVGANKDGIDPLGPGYMRDDFRSQMFKPPNLLASTGIQAELLRRGDLEMMFIANMSDQLKWQGKVIKTPLPMYDPRSGAGMPADAYLMPSMDPNKFGMTFVQPMSAYHNPMRAQYDPGYTKRGLFGANQGSTLRGKTVSPLGIGGESSGPKAVFLRMPDTTTKRSNNSTQAPRPDKVSQLPTGFTPAKATQETVTQKVYKALAQKQALKDAQQQVAQNNRTKTQIAVVASAQTCPTSGQTLATDPSRKSNQFKGNGFREAYKHPDGGVVLPEHLYQDELELGSQRCRDTADSGTRGVGVDRV